MVELEQVLARIQGPRVGDEADEPLDLLRLRLCGAPSGEHVLETETRIPACQADERL